MKSPAKSKTMRFALALAMLGAAETVFPTLKPLLGDYYGLVFVPIAVAVAYLRFVTTEPIKNVSKD